MHRVGFFNRYKDGDKIAEKDKSIFEELEKDGYATTRGTDRRLWFTHIGRAALKKEELDARCDLRARVRRFFLWIEGKNTS